MAGKWQASSAGCPFPVPKVSSILLRGRENKRSNGNSRGYTIRSEAADLAANGLWAATGVHRCPMFLLHMI